MPASIYIVTSLADTATPGTLRFVISQANAANTGTAADPDQIQFTTGGGTISVIGVPLPALTDVAILDATTATGYSGSPIITLDGSLAAPGASGLTISAGSSTVKGFDIISFSGHGLLLDTNGGNTIVNNYIGITTTSVVTANDANGILISGTSDNNIGGSSATDANVISGNGGDGIRIDGPNASNNLIAANFIGTDATGTLDRGNAHDGVSIRNGAHNNLIGRSDPVSGVTYFSADDVSLQPVTAWQGIRNSDTPGQYLMVGSSVDTGLLFDGTIAGVGTSYAVNFPGAATTSVYGPDNLNGTTIRLVGTYKNADASTAAVKVNGFLFEGTIADLANSNNYRTIDIPGAEFNYIHSTMGGLAVGNYDSASAHGTFSLPLGPGHAFLYDVATSTVLTDITFPNSISNTAYGIWYNGGTSYTICGGWSPDPVNNFADQNVAIGDGYLVDFDSATGQFTNWTSFTYPNGNNFVTHFEGISSVEKGIYTLNADSGQSGSSNPVQGSWVTLRRNTDGSFGAATWVDLNYPNNSTPTLVSSSNSVYGNQVVGLAVGVSSASFQATINTGFQLSNVISGNGGNGIGVYSANDNQIAMNYIGTDVTGTLDLGNDGNGILITAGAARNQIGGQATGGNDPTAGTFVRPPQGNLISGNNANGVLIDNAATMNIMSGNFVGTSASGISALGNTLDGVAIDNADGNQLIGCTFRQDPFVFYNVLSGNGGNGLRINDSNNTTVQANFFGMGSNNATAVGNALDGMLIEGSSANTQFGGVIPLGNVVVANGRNGVEIRDTASGTVCFNTFNGLPAFVDTAMGNALDGFLITSTGGNNQLRTNVIAGNHGNGIHISGDATGVEVTEDIIGLDTNGQLPLGNQANGILIDGNAHGNNIGGLQPSVILQTTISANGGNGIAILGTAHNNLVIHSFIGSNINGITAYGNEGAGIFIGGSAFGNTIGGTGQFEQVLISGNLGDGILLGGSSTGTVVIGNLIGTDRTGLIGMPNQGSGVSILGSNNRIGGDTAAEQNAIAFNTHDGVAIASGTGDGVLGNSIFANAGLGIRLTAGGNFNQRAPVLNSADLLASTVHITGTLTAAANTTYRIEFFASNTPGQGRTFLGYSTVATDANGRVRFSASPTIPANAGASITATATDQGNNTSVFSTPVNASAAIFAVGAGIGGLPQVNVYDAHGNLQRTILAFDSDFRGGVRVAVGHIGGEQVIVAAAGPGGGPHVRVFDAMSGLQVPGELGSFFAYSSDFAGGVFVALGDFDGDGSDDIVTGAGAGGGPNVKVFNGRDATVLQSFFAFDAGFHGGVSVAAGFINGDIHADIITGAGAGGGPQVKVFDGGNSNVVLSSFFAFDAGFRGGVSVAAGNLHSGAIDLIIVGAGAGGGPQVNIYTGLSTSPFASFFAYAPNFTGGVRVGAFDTNGDGQDDLITGAGPGGGPQVNIGSSITRQFEESFFAFDPSFTGGVFVGG